MIKYTHKLFSTYGFDFYYDVSSGTVFHLNGREIGRKYSKADLEENGYTLKLIKRDVENK